MSLIVAAADLVSWYVAWPTVARSLWFSGPCALTIGAGLVGTIFRDKHVGIYHDRRDNDDVNATTIYTMLMESAPNHTEIAAAFRGRYESLFVLEKAGDYYIGFNPMLNRAFIEAVTGATLSIWASNQTWCDEPIASLRQASDRVDQVLALIPDFDYSKVV